MCRMPGSWSSFDHLEESLTLDEMFMLLGQAVDLENSNREFAASLKGIDLKSGGNAGQDRFDEIVERAQAKASGMSEEEYSFSMAGFGFEETD